MEIDKNILLEQYKLYVGTSEKVSDRRLSVNKYFLALNTILLSFEGYLSTMPYEIWHMIIAVSGMLICVFWLLILKSYRGLNSAKFKVIHNMEKDMPYKLFKDEWDFMGKGKNSSKYIKLSVLEQGIPIVFGFLYFIITIFILF